jgi:hypothetical protein
MNNVATSLITSYLIRKNNRVPTVEESSDHMFMAGMIALLVEPEKDILQFISKRSQFMESLHYMEQVKLVNLQGERRAHPRGLPPHVHHWLSNVVHAIHNAENIKCA